MWTEEMDRELLDLLSQYNYAPELLDLAIEQTFPSLSRQDVYQRIFFLLGRVQLLPAEVSAEWQAFLDYHQELMRLLGRPVSIQVAFLDFFYERKNYYHDPIVLERSVYNYTKAQTFVDSLTGLYNYRFLRDFLHKESKRASRHNEMFSVILIDIDDFKNINDRFGHIAGDIVLQHTAKMMLDVLRQEDIAIRYGGDEFMIILPETNLEGAKRCADRLLALMKETSISFHDTPLHISYSMGLATFGYHSKEALLLLELADRALYAAKKAGKGCWRTTEVNYLSSS
ncbi:GGDEF domain-containing protein [Thermospira aquatica]|uniref:diguanylate cyclase n=1 Tax=Thermospira aquatica TaxID=2828656 RepID=A0AAX3BEY7_9SPIR|nr:GGDEF domain-containing protein [Thermospira aquatica]URA10835.1 GGDEF domain-containing protein [Thermospira aquatica]